MRIHKINNKPINSRGKYVLYWMIGSRRTRYNAALDRVLYWCQKLGTPALVFEPLRLGYKYASERVHSFVLEGMSDNARILENRDINYLPFVEQQPNEGKGLLEALAKDATLVVTDFTPVFFLPHMIEAAGRKISVNLEAVDSVGLVPLSLMKKTYPAAVHFRRFIQKNFLLALSETPAPDSLNDIACFGRSKVPKSVSEKCGDNPRDILENHHSLIQDLPLDHSVKHGLLVGGSKAALDSLDRFIDTKLSNYEKNKNNPDITATSILSPYLHFGHIATHEIFIKIAEAEDWSPADISNVAKGQRSGWFEMSESAEAFLDQLLTWRELSISWALLRSDWHLFNTLPEWVIETLERHATDPRIPIYTLEELENAKTHDPLWNAAQVQLLREGLLHGYLRMYWGKMILAWTKSPKEALRRMLYLNDKYALDGRDPNSISGCSWCLGRFDRPWWPERKVFGRVRYMSSKNTLRKVSCSKYIERYLG